MEAVLGSSRSVGPSAVRGRKRKSMGGLMCWGVAISCFIAAWLLVRRVIAGECGGLGDALCSMKVAMSLLQKLIGLSK